MVEALKSLVFIWPAMRALFYAARRAMKIARGFYKLFLSDFKWGFFDAVCYDYFVQLINQTHLVNFARFNTYLAKIIGW